MARFCSLALTALGGALFAPVSAQLPLPLGPSGGRVEAIRIDPDDPAHVLLGTSIAHVDGLLESTDGGLQWQPAGAGLPAGVPVYQVASSGDDSDKVVALAGTGVYVSLDDGASFALSHDFGETMLQLAVHPTQPTWIATSALEAWRTDDGGASWTSVFSSTWSNGSFYSAPLFAPSQPTRAYLAVGDRVWRSDDSGASWTEMPQDLSIVWALAVNPLDADEVWVGEYASLKRSSDGAQNFAPHPAPYAWPFLPHIRLLAYDDSAPSPRLWMPLGGEIFALDASGSWVAEDAGLQDKEPFASTLAFASGTAWLGSYGDGIWKRASAASNWEQRGLERERLYSALINEPGGLQIVAGSGVYWRFGNAPFDEPIAGISSSQALRKIVVDPSDPTRWLVARGAGYESSLIEVTGNGSLWNQLPIPGASQTLRDLAFDPFDPSRVLAASTYAVAGVLTSTDGGASWTSQYNQVFAGASAVAFDPYVPDRALALSLEGELLESLDAGQSWALIDTPAQLGEGAELEFDPHTPGRVFRADTTNGWSRSDDGGTSWTPLGHGAHAHSTLLFHPDQPDLVWFGDDTGTLRLSGSAGTQDVTAFATPAGTLVSGVALDSANGDLLVATLGESAFELKKHAPYVALGAGTPGTGGLAPRHFAQGGLPQTGNAAWGLRVEDAQPGAFVYLGVGTSESALPVLGGTLIASLPHVIQLGGFADAAGTLSLGLPVPASPGLAGASVVSQAIAADAGAPAGFAFSAGLRTTVMP